MLNFALLRNPLNWFIVILMLWIAMFGFHVLAKGMSQSPSTSE